MFLLYCSFLNHNADVDVIADQHFAVALLIIIIIIINSISTDFGKHQKGLEYKHRTYNDHTGHNLSAYNTWSVKIASNIVVGAPEDL